MLETSGDIVSIGLGALAVGYIVYEIDRRQRRLHEIWGVLGAHDEARTALLEKMVETGELQPYTGGALP
ncbi:MAG TPA: hypothetical protein VGM32_24535 [Rhodopila sp.]|jgi:hypothetical protein